MKVVIREYRENDINEMIKIWNEVVEEGEAFPQIEPLNFESGREFFASQTCCTVAEDTESKKLLGLYILHPNNVGRCGHICNASYAVSSESRGLHIGGKLVKDCLSRAKDKGFRIIQFNAVVKENIPARKLYKKLGFTELGIIPEGFLRKNGNYADIVLYYKRLT